MIPIHLKTILELLRKLRAIRGPEIDYAWLSYLLELYHGKQEILGLLLILSHRYLENPLLESQVLLTPPAKELIDGEYRLGNVLYSGQKLWPFGLEEGDWIRHILIAGKSGFGKTNLARLIALNLLEHQKPFLIFDWKKNFRCLLKLHPSAYCFTVGRNVAPFQINVMRPPPGVLAKEWLGHLVDTLCEAYFLGHGAHRILTEVIHQAFKEHGVYAGKQTYPDWKDIYSRLELLRMKAKSRELMWIDSSMRVAFALGFGPIGQAVNQDALQIHELLEHNVILELEALNASDKKFLTEIILQYILSYRKAHSQPREVFRHALICDEGHHIFLERPAEFQAESVPDRIFREIREYGESLIICDQHISKISRAAVGNSSVIFSFHTSLAQDIKTVSGAMSIEQEYFSQLPPGQAIVKMSARHYQPFLIQVPLLTLKDTQVSDPELALRSQFFLERLATLRGIQAAIQDSALPQSYFRRSRKTTGYFPKPRVISPSQDSAIKEELETQDEGNNSLEGLSAAEQGYLIDVLKYPHAGIVERNERLEVHAKKGNQLKQRLIEKGLLKVERVSTGTGRKIILQITQQGLELLATWGYTPTLEKRQGGAEHEYWKEQIKAHLEDHGYQVTSEYPLNGRTVDLVAEQGQEKIAIEIETGKSDYQGNLEKCLESKQFSSIYIITLSSQLKTKVIEFAQQLQAKKVNVMMPQEFTNQAKKLNLVRTYCKYFRGRDNAYTEQVEDGTYRKVEGPLTGKEITDVLKGRKTYGLYQILQSNMVHFICFDLDNHDGKHAAAAFQAQVKQLVRFLLSKGLKKEQILVEKSSNAGYHLWLFFKIPLLCGKAYQFVQFVQEAAGLECEGFPKQPYIDLEGYGNCIRLPLSIHRKKQERSVFVTLDLEEVPFHQGIEHLARIQKIDTRFVNRYVQEKPLPKPSTREGPLQGQPAKMREHCDFIRFVEQHPDQVTEPQWFLFLELCCAFGEPGIQYAYQVSSNYHQFREGEFWRKVKYIQRRGYKAPTCGKIRSLFRDCCCAPQDAGRSPARFAFK